MKTSTRLMVVELNKYPVFLRLVKGSGLAAGFALPWRSTDSWGQYLAGPGTLLHIPIHEIGDSLIQRNLRLPTQ